MKDVLHKNNIYIHIHILLDQQLQNFQTILAFFFFWSDSLFFQTILAFYKTSNLQQK